jgi:dinuclear metal center YbgI/SA1388 family protein
MTKLNAIVSYLNKELKVRSIKDPWCKNGLQVKGNSEVDVVGVSTDACMDVFRKAEKLGCDLVLTHHGLFQPKSSKFERKLNGEKKKFLLSKKMSLYSAHLPLDKSAKHGNNILLCKIMGAKPVGVFDGVGYVAQLPKGKGLGELSKTLRKALGSNVKIYPLGKTKGIKKVAVCSGYGGGGISEAIAKKVDLYVTGEISHGGVVKIRDSKMSVIVAGHYATETVGVIEVAEMLREKFGLRTVFINSPTGM